MKFGHYLSNRTLNLHTTAESYNKSIVPYSDEGTCKNRKFLPSVIDSASSENGSSPTISHLHVNLSGEADVPARETVRTKSDETTGSSLPIRKEGYTNSPCAPRTCILKVPALDVVRLTGISIKCSEPSTNLTSRCNDVSVVGTVPLISTEKPNGEHARDMFVTTQDSTRLSSTIRYCVELLKRNSAEGEADANKPLTRDTMPLGLTGT